MFKESEYSVPSPSTSEAELVAARDEFNENPEDVLEVLHRFPRLLRQYGLPDEPWPRSNYPKRPREGEEGDAVPKRLRAIVEEDDVEEGEEEEEDYSRYFVLERLNEHQSRLLRSTVEEFRVRMRDSAHLSGEALLFRLENIIRAIVKEITRNLNGDDKFRIVIQSDSLKFPIAIPYTRLSDFDLDNLFAYISKVLQYDTVRLDSSFIISISKTFYPEPGTGRVTGGIGNRNIGDLRAWLKKKQSVIEVSREEEICGFLAIVIARELLNGKTYESFRRKSGWLRTEARALANAAGIDFGGLDLDGIAKIQTSMPEYQLVVFQIGDIQSKNKKKFLNALFRGPPTEKRIHLLLLDNHFFVIKSLAAFYGQESYCLDCDTAYTRNHVCPVKCKHCQAPTCKNRSKDWVDVLLTCPNCNRDLRTNYCIEAHNEEICQQRAKCIQCSLVVKRSKLEPVKHRCGEMWCRTCKCWRPRSVDHHCYIPTGSKHEEPAEDTDTESNSDTASSTSESSSNRRETTQELFYYDFETFLSVRDRHFVPILCVVQSERGDETIFKGTTTADQFVDFILGMDYRRVSRTFLAHYSQGFDHFCFLRTLYSKRIRMDIISRGQKIQAITMMSGRLRLIDSISFIPMSLASFAKAFSLEETDSKDFYPYALLKCEEQTVDEKIDQLTTAIRFPSREEFEERSMMPDRQKEFASFYEEASIEYGDEPRYVPWDELVKYCQQDVRTLRQGCQAFRTIYKDVTGTDCFTSGITLVSANFKVFCKNYCNHDQIALVSDHGFAKGHYSQIGLIWLEYMARSNLISIRHGGNGYGEQKIGPYLVDGYSDTPPMFTHPYTRTKPSKATIYLFHGCIYHGCSICYPDRDRVFLGETMQSRYARTMRTETFLRSHNVHLITMWSHDFEPFMQRDPRLREEARLSGALNKRLLPRDGYFGGRVELFKIYHRCEPNTSIRYFDVNSLYPTTMIAPLEPGFYTGLPTVIRNNFGDIDQYKGLLFGRIICDNRQLYLPVLPVRIKQESNDNRKPTSERLFFCICRRCAEIRNCDIPCDHSEYERSFETILTTEEWALAKSKGYRILELFEVWHYPENQRSIDLFAPFQRKWIQLKAEASGWPASVRDSEDAKQAYLDKYRDTYGIEIDPSKVSLNEAMRTTAKLIANALYGRLGMRSDRSSVSLVNEFDELRKLLQDPNIEVRDLYPIEEDQMFATYKTLDNCGVESINLVLCMQVTSMSRMILYNALETIHETNACQLLYADTDSIIFAASDTWSPNIEVGDVLGQWKDEVKKGSRIILFAGTGAKSYVLVFETSDGLRVELKLKGFRMDFGTRELITLESILELIRREQDDIMVKMKLTVRDMRKGTIGERDIEKSLRMTTDKRPVDDDYTTVPFGYVKTLIASLV